MVEDLKGTAARQELPRLKTPVYPESRVDRNGGTTPIRWVYRRLFVSNNQRTKLLPCGSDTLFRTIEALHVKPSASS